MDQLSSDAQSISQQFTIYIYTDEEFKDCFYEWAALLTLADKLDRSEYLRTADARLQLLVQDTIDKHLIPLFDECYKSSILLQQVSLLLSEVVRRARRPAFTAHVEPSITLKGERCSICLEGLEDNSVSMGWRKSHSPVITSCGHIFGGNCLSIWLSSVSTRSCPCCRKDFNRIGKDCDLMWETRGDMWRWYRDRKHTRLACEGACG